MQRTLPAADGAGPGGASGRRGPQLYQLLECERPHAGSARFLLRDVDLVEVGRGERPDFTIEGRRLVVRVPDPRMSVQHARLRRTPRGFEVEDAGSTNGTLVGGAAVQRHALADGEVLELGYTLFLYRADAPDPPDPTPCVAASSLAAPHAVLVTLCPDLERQLAVLPQVAAAGVSVIVGGESGTGKGLLARALHELSGRSGRFVPVNCGALPETIVETELFGYKKGAFSGAAEDRPGLVRSADGGTLFLDEIADLPLEIQAAFLRVLQEREVVPVGATRPVEVDLRVVSATHGDLPRLSREGRFRADLLARIAGLELLLPPLRQRREDLGLLIGALLKRVAPRRRVTFERAAARALAAYAWPLNVRELEQCLAGAVALAGDAPIGVPHLPAHVTAAARSSLPPRVAAASSSSSSVDPVREALVAALEAHRGNVSAVAREMGKARMQVQRWMARYGIDPEQYRR